MPDSAEHLGQVLAAARRRLLDERSAGGHWVGHLSSSALSTATAVTALALTDRAAGDPDRPYGRSGSPHARLIEAGLAWLARHQNADGGWGDTPDSPSNLSTTLLAWAALGQAAAARAPRVPTPLPSGEVGRRPGEGEPRADLLSQTPSPGPSGRPPPQGGGVAEAPTRPFGPTSPEGGGVAEARAVGRAEAYIIAQAGGLGTPIAIHRDWGPLAPEQLARALAGRYGRDRSFSAPILAMLALCGRLGAGQEAWRHVAALPFELAALPRGLLRRLSLPVVSYALPALIAVGQVRHHFRPAGNPLARLVRRAARARTLAVLEELQPTSGGFLEAQPLTSFVVMCLAAMGLSGHGVARRGVEFLRATARPDGSWPIDTNLATWVTTLAVGALARDGRLDEHLPADQRRAVLDWLLAQQHAREHPYTRAGPGGWAWTDLSGGVPDADDTPGALLALRRLDDGRSEVAAAAQRGVAWLLGLQNRDGGWPTFCRGWQLLPFDRSAADLTAHALLALAAWGRASAINRAMRRGIEFLVRSQRADGAFLPLWFGNQHAPHQANPVYGTARVLMALAELAPEAVAAATAAAAMADRAAAFLIGAQGPDGGWGGAPGVAPSIEETAVAVDALCRLAGSPAAADTDGQRHRDAIARGVSWLIARTDGGRHFPAQPIGLYFARLWYSEQLYPLIFTVSALAGAERALRRE